MVRFVLFQEKAEALQAVGLGTGTRSGLRLESARHTVGVLRFSRACQVSAGPQRRAWRCGLVLTPKAWPLRGPRPWFETW